MKAKKPASQPLPCLVMDLGGQVSAEERQRMAAVVGRLGLWVEYLEGRHGSAVGKRTRALIAARRRRAIKAMDALMACLDLQQGKMSDDLGYDR